MPDSDVDKPKKTPSSKPGAGDRAGSAKPKPAEEAMSLEQELDRLLADIEIAVDDLDPLGDLEQTAAKARQDANAGDPDYDETEDLFDVVTPAGTEKPEDTDEIADAAEARTQTPEEDPARTAPTSTLDAELDDLIEEVPPSPTRQIPVSDAGTARPEQTKRNAASVEHSQIDQELDALLAEAGSLLDEQDETDQAESSHEPEEALNASTKQEMEEDAVETVEDVLDTGAEPSGGAQNPESRPETDDQTGVRHATAERAEQIAEPAPQPSVEQHRSLGTESPDAGEEEEPAEAQSASENAEAQARSIEDVDAALAARADEVAEADDEASEAAAKEGEAGVAARSENDDAFRTSEDVVESVIDTHASAVQEGSDAPEDADDLAQLMAQSPASADLGVAESAQRAERETGATNTGTASATVPPKPATAEPTPDAAKPTPQHTSDGAPRRLATLWLRVRPAALRVARVLSKPMEVLPPRVRDDIGWLALVTLFLALAVLTALLLFR